MQPIKLIYWDSSIFIAWLKNEKRPNSEMDGVHECVKDTEVGKIKLITSVITRTEVFETNLSEDVKKSYEKLLNRRNVLLLDQDLRVSNLSREIREYYNRQRDQDGLPGITTPDAIHLATAIHYGAHAFYTFDNGKKSGRSLLSLNGNVAGHPLTICKPPIVQFRLHFNVDTY